MSLIDTVNATTFAQPNVIQLGELREEDVGTMLCLRGDYDRFYPLSLIEKFGLSVFTDKLSLHVLDITPLKTGDTLMVVGIREFSASSISGFEDQSGTGYRKSDDLILIQALHNGEYPLIALASKIRNPYYPSYTVLYSPSR